MLQAAKDVCLAAADDVTRQRCVRIIERRRAPPPPCPTFASSAALTPGLLDMKSSAAVKAALAALGVAMDHPSVEGRGMCRPSRLRSLLKLQGLHVAAFRAAGCDWSTIRTAGFSAAEAKAAGCDPASAHAAGYDPRRSKLQGLTSPPSEPPDATGRPSEQRGSLRRRPKLRAAILHLRRQRDTTCLRLWRRTAMMQLKLQGLTSAAYS